MKIHLLDGTYELFRGFYGPPPRQAPDGREVGATISLLQSLITLLADPEVTHLACAFDHVVESFRNELFAGYKTGEDIHPKLIAQFTLAEQAVAALGIPVWSMIEFEADDAIATAVHHLQKLPEVEQIVICSPDKDLTQLVKGDKIVCWDRRRSIVYHETAVIEKYGVTPASIPDWLALVGDAADGIPGVAAWGAKSSAAVLSQYPHIEDIPLALDEWQVTVRGAKRLHENLLAYREQALLYRQLTTLQVDVPLGLSLDELHWKGARADFASFCESLGAKDLPARLPIK